MTPETRQPALPLGMPRPSDADELERILADRDIRPVSSRSSTCGRAAPSPTRPWPPARRARRSRAPADLGDDGPEWERRFDFALTHDRDLVTAAARTLVARVAPLPTG